MARPLRSPRITGVLRYYGPVRPCASHRLLNSSQFHLLEALAAPTSHPRQPRYRDDRFPSSTRTPGLRSRRLYAGHHLANQQAPARLIPEQRLDPGFDVIHTLTTLHRTVRFRSPSQPTPDAIRRRAVSASSAPRLLTAAPCGGLPPPPAGRRRRIGPSIIRAAPHPEDPRDLRHRGLLSRSWRTIVCIPFKRDGRKLADHHASKASCRNRFASTGETAEPCGVPGLAAARSRPAAGWVRQATA
jgi:hypothetical protein